MPAAWMQPLCRAANGRLSAGPERKVNDAGRLHSVNAQLC